MFHSIKPSWSSHFRLSWCVFFFLHYRILKDTPPATCIKSKPLKWRTQQWSQLCPIFAAIETNTDYIDRLDSDISIHSLPPTDLILCILHPLFTIFPLGSCAWMPASLLLWSNLPTQQNHGGSNPRTMGHLGSNNGVCLFFCVKKPTKAATSKRNLHGNFGSFGTWHRLCVFFVGKSMVSFEWTSGSLKQKEMFRFLHATTIKSL